MKELIQNAEFDEKYDFNAYQTTTLYFTASKKLLAFLPKEYPDAISSEISVEFPSENPEANASHVMLSPTNDMGEDYDWCEFNIPLECIETLLEIAKKRN